MQPRTRQVPLSTSSGAPVKPAGSARKRKLSDLVTPQATHDPFRDVEPPNRIRR